MDENRMPRSVVVLVAVVAMSLLIVWGLQVLGAFGVTDW